MYEVWNEPQYFGWWDRKDWLKEYCELFKEVGHIIKREDPQAKVACAGMGYFDCFSEDTNKLSAYKALDYGLADHMDAFSWHVQHALHRVRCGPGRL